MAGETVARSKPIAYWIRLPFRGVRVFLGSRTEVPRFDQVEDGGEDWPSLASAVTAYEVLEFERVVGVKSRPRLLEKSA